VGTRGSERARVVHCMSGARLHRAQAQLLSRAHLRSWRPIPETKRARLSRHRSPFPRAHRMFQNPSRTFRTSPPLRVGFAVGMIARNHDKPRDAPPSPISQFPPALGFPHSANLTERYASGTRLGVFSPLVTPSPLCTRTARNHHHPTHCQLPCPFLVSLLPPSLTLPRTSALQNWTQLSVLPHGHATDRHRLLGRHGRGVPRQGGPGSDHKRRQRRR
jgi:hypothetical protein